MESDAPLTDRLLVLRDSLVPPRTVDGTRASLVALMPCEPAIGEVAVVAWNTSDGGEFVELVRLDGGERIDDPVALRESLTLLAMVETVEDLASFNELEPLESQMAAFARAGSEIEKNDHFTHASTRARAALAALRAFEPGDAPRIARPQLLDSLGGALREFERSWERFEQAAELWSDAHLAAHGRSRISVERVQSLWRWMSIARRGPLARPVAAALHEGREAGMAMAEAVASTGPVIR